MSFHAEGYLCWKILVKGEITIYLATGYLQNFKEVKLE